MKNELVGDFPLGRLDVGDWRVTALILSFFTLVSVVFFSTFILLVHHVSQPVHPGGSSTDTLNMRFGRIETRLGRLEHLQGHGTFIPADITEEAEQHGVK